MRKILLIVLLATHPISAQSCPSSIDEFSHWASFYYQKPDPNNIICSLEYYSNSSYFADKTDSRIPMANFFAAALSSDRDELNRLFDSMTYSGSRASKIFALRVFWVMDDDTARRYLEKANRSWVDPEIKGIIKEMKSVRPPNPMMSKPVTRGDLGNLWAIYFATGNKQAIEQIASAIHQLEDGKGVETPVVVGAKWGLVSNAKYHKEIINVLKKLSKNASGVQKEEINAIIKTITKRGRGKGGGGIK